MEQKNYKRKTREMSDDTKQKISAKLKGRRKSAQTCKSISDGLKIYWHSIPSSKIKED
jgi:hypothetical protein